MNDYFKQFEHLKRPQDFTKRGRIALVDADLLDAGTRHPNLVIMKIAGYLKEQACDVHLIEDYSELYGHDSTLLDFDEDGKMPDKYAKEKQKTEKAKKELKPFFYQEAAVKKWEENGRTLLLQMATGCGKTKTAIACISYAVKDTEPLLVVISTPQATLSAQWKRDIDELDVLKMQGEEVIIPSKFSFVVQGGTAWRQNLRKRINKLKTGFYPYLIVYITHTLAHSEDFLDIIRESGPKVTKFLVGDEVHGLGAKEFRTAMDESYSYRLGLSATPQRWFDDVGSDLIAEYFGNDSYEFTIEDALREHNPLTGKTFLVNYYYHPKFVQLDDDEMDAYRKLTEKLAKLASKGGDIQLQSSLL